MDAEEIRYTSLMGQLAAVESAVIYLLQQEFSRQSDPTAQATAWFDNAISSAGRTDHALELVDETEQQGAQAVLAELHHELLRMKAHVLRSLV